jgi:hypothetical protein
VVLTHYPPARIQGILHRAEIVTGANSLARAKAGGDNPLKCNFGLAVPGSMRDEGRQGRLMLQIATSRYWENEQSTGKNFR